MKVYKRKHKFAHPNDMSRIICHLEECGEILVEHSVLEDLYSKFCEEKYSTSWINVCLQILNEFEEWLYEYEE